MFTVKGVAVYEGYDLTVHEAESGDYERISQKPALFIQAGLKPDELYSLYLETYDYALPQEWVDGYLSANSLRKHPDAVWCYKRCDDDSHSLLGYPIFRTEIVSWFERDAKAVLEKLGEKTFSGYCPTCGMPHYFREAD